MSIGGHLEESSKRLIMHRHGGLCVPECTLEVADHEFADRNQLEVTIMPKATPADTGTSSLPTLRRNISFVLLEEA